MEMLSKDMEIGKNKVCVIGLGYVGMPIASMLATSGYKVIGVDIDKSKLELIKSGEMYTEEPGLRDLIQNAISSGNLILKTSPEQADIFIVCVQTPLDMNIKKSDLKYIESATESIVPLIKKDDLFVLESTVPPNTTKEVLIPILNKSGLFVGKDIHVAHCPERILPGNTLKELVENDRVIGGINIKSAELAKNVYKSFVDGDIYLTDLTTAEFTKLMENTYRDINIALANEFEKISEKISINIWDAIKLANKHPRVNIHMPGPGVGGHCINVDPWFIIEKTPKEAKLIALARMINDDMPIHVAKIVENVLSDIKNPVITVFGVAYKGDVGDSRESPAKKIIDFLNKKHDIRIYDPYVKEFGYKLMDLYDSLRGSDCILVLADHNKFNSLDIEKIGNLMRNKKLIDTRNYLNHNDWKSRGFKIYVLGDGSSK